MKMPRYLSPSITDIQHSVDATEACEEFVLSDGHHQHSLTFSKAEQFGKDKIKSNLFEATLSDNHVLIEGYGEGIGSGLCYLQQKWQ